VKRLLAMSLTGTLMACIEATPFGMDVERTNLNSENLSLLREATLTEPPKFAVLGDSHDDYDGLADTVRLVTRRKDLGFVTHLGDFASRGLLQEFEWTDRALSESSLPVFVVLGNHDCLSSGRDIYRTMYGPFDFTFQWAGHRFVFFNSNTLEFGVEVPRRGWLEQQLTQLEPGERAVLITHQGPVRSESAGLNRLDEFYRRLIETYDVALFVHGHTHDFRLYAVGSTPRLQSSPVVDEHAYAIVTLSPNVAVERCRNTTCVAVNPEPE
jgi:predicted phosphodiesterase